MNNYKPRMEMRKLTTAEKKEVEQREREHREKLAHQGYTTQALVDETGCFGIVLVSDPKLGRKGLLLPNGNVRWIDFELRPGVLADAAVTGISIDLLPE